MPLILSVAFEVRKNDVVRVIYNTINKCKSFKFSTESQT